MAAPFDHIAPTYDEVFSRSVIGQLQRKQVWRYLESVTPELRGLEILELNCGTGEDAVLFSEKGFNIVATDVSEEMLKITAQKANQFSMQSRISSQYLDLDSFDETVFTKKFDLIFSNFGGLNCINPESLKKLLRRIPTILTPGGRFIGVVMPRFCFWETCYQLLKFRPRKAFRRFTRKEVMVDLQGTPLKAWYYNPSHVKSWSRDNFSLVDIRPIGFALPPSYLEQYFSRRKRLLLRLNQLERRFEKLSLIAGLADHFLIDLKLK
jgi:ubiquinone/menaquinone biosynthesis C-methylase UbiE